MAQSEALEKLASTGLLKHEPPGREEIAGLLHTAAVRLGDARKTTNAPESRFDLAYNAAHAFALAALRIHLLPSLIVGLFFPEGITVSYSQHPIATIAALLQNPAHRRIPAPSAVV